MFRQKFLASASVLFLTSSLPAAAQIASQSGPETVTVTAQALEQARAGIQTQLGASTFVPSKVCDACKIGYFMTRVGWVAVATFE